MISFFLLGLYGRMVAYLPSCCVFLWSALLARLALATSLRERVKRGMKRFPWSEDPDVDELTIQHVRFLTDMFHCLLFLGYHHRPHNRVSDRVTREGEGHLRKALKDKRGVILVSLHLGNFFWSISYLAGAYPTNVVIRRESDPRWEAFSLRMRNKLGIKTIYSERGALQIKGRLKQGELVVFVIDQYTLPFFYGSNHPLKKIVPRVAQMTDVPVILFYTLYKDRDIIVRFLPPLQEVSPSVLEGMLLQMIRENPHLWFWWRRLGKIKRGQRKA